MEKKLTAKEAAEILGVNDSRVRQMILNGDLPAEKFGPVWTIRTEDLNLVKERPSPGYPKGRPRETRPGGVMEEAAPYEPRPGARGGLIEGRVVARPCPHCGHHEIGVETPGGAFRALRPGERVLLEPEEERRS